MQFSLFDRDNKGQWFPFIIVGGIILVFALGFWGYLSDETLQTLKKGEETYHEEYHFWNSLYTVIGMFLMAGLEPNFQNWQMVLAAFLAACILGYGIIQLTWAYLSNWWKSLKTRNFYTNHTVIVGNSRIAYRIATEMLRDRQKVVLIEKREQFDDNLSKIASLGGIVLEASNSESDSLLMAGIRRAKFCLVLTNDDEYNLQTANILSWINQQYGMKGNLKALIYVEGWYNTNFLKDYMDRYNRTKKFDIDAFNAELAAAQMIYDEFSPLHKVSYRAVEGKAGAPPKIEAADNGIMLIGLNHTAEMFLLENIILSHSPGMKNLMVVLVDRDIKDKYKDLLFKFPFLEDYVSTHLIELEDENFYAEVFNDETALNALNLLSGVYIFGDNDPYLITLANSARQWLYASIGDLKEIPIVVCLPEKTNALGLLTPELIKSEGESTPLYKELREYFNINVVRLITDTCTKGRLIEEVTRVESVAKAINYFYSMKYEFAYLLSDDVRKKLDTPLLQQVEDIFLSMTFSTLHPLQELEKAVLSKLEQGLGVPASKLKKDLGIHERWHALNDLKQESNRYVARHLRVKIAFIEKMGHETIDREVISQYFHVFAPVEHKRWCAEKLAFKFRFGEYPQDDPPKKSILKNYLKIHDQLIPYEELSKEMEDKDFNMFLLIPVLRQIEKLVQERQKQEK